MAVLRMLLRMAFSARLISVALCSVSRMQGDRLIFLDLLALDPQQLRKTAAFTYAILRHSDIDRAKTAHLANALSATGLVIDPFDLRYDTDIRPTLRLAPAVLVGVDDIPTRWQLQRAHPDWMAVGATTHWCAMASFHEAHLGCAECAHPYDDPNGGRIPTVAFVSFWAGLLTASYLLRHQPRRLGWAKVKRPLVFQGGGRSPSTQPSAR
jgi:hypothetical protein